MFLQGDQRPQAGGGECIEQEECAGPVTGKVFVTALIALAQHQRLRLRNGVGQQQLVVLGQLVRGRFDGNELQRHHVGALVQHLKVGVLAIGARLAPQHRCGAVGQCLSIAVHTFAVALHLQLLHIRRQAAQAAVVGRDGSAGVAQKVAVPNIQQAQAHRQVLRQRRLHEVLVHGVRPGQQVFEPLRSDGDRQRQTYGRPQGIAAAHPVPKTESGGDAHGRCCRHVGRQRHKVARHIGAALRPEPGQHRARIGHGLDRGEGLGRDQAERALRLQALEHRRQLMPIHIRNEMQSLARHRNVLQGLHRHLRPQVRAAYADVDHIGDRGVAAHLLGAGQHGLQGRMHLRQRLGQGPLKAARRLPQ